MESGKKIVIICCFLLFSCMMAIHIVSAQIEYVNFQGIFVNGTTLYSQTYNLDSVKLFSKDVYPIKDNSMNQRVKNCTTTYRESTRRVCFINDSGWTDGGIVPEAILHPEVRQPNAVEPDELTV